MVLAGGRARDTAAGAFIGQLAGPWAGGALACVPASQELRGSRTTLGFQSPDGFAEYRRGRQRLKYVVEISPMRRLFKNFPMQ